MRAVRNLWQHRELTWNCSRVPPITERSHGPDCCRSPRASLRPRCAARRRHPAGSPLDLDPGLSRGACRDRAARRASVGGRSSRPIDARREPDEMAPRAYHLVLRAIPARPAPGRLYAFRRALRLSVQLLLCGGGSPPCAPEARPYHAADESGGRRLSGPCRCRGREADRRHACRQDEGDPPDPRDRTQSRAAAPGAHAHRHPARLRRESRFPGL